MIVQHLLLAAIMALIFGAGFLTGWSSHSTFVTTRRTPR